MLYTLFLLWAFAVAVPATLLAIVIIGQAALGHLRRLTTSTTVAGAAEA